MKPRKNSDYILKTVKNCCCDLRLSPMIKAQSSYLGVQMFDIQNYGSFLGAILLFQAVPGAGTIAILDATAREGRTMGMAAVAGTIVGDFIFMVAAAAGLAAVLQASPFLFGGLQWFGSAYLLWMGVKLIRTNSEDGLAIQERATSAWTYFRRALSVSLTNPKVILFFVAFFPLFMRPGASMMTLTVMMAHVSILSLVYQGLLVLVGNEVAARLKTLPSARSVAIRVAGVALILLSVKLAMGIF